jgi:hypothetical protein
VVLVDLDQETIAARAAYEREYAERQREVHRQGAVENGHNLGGVYGFTIENAPAWWDFDPTPPPTWPGEPPAGLDGEPLDVS